MSEIIRLDKYLADMGCGTRSQVKQMIRKGQVEINGEKIKNRNRRSLLLRIVYAWQEKKPL